MKASERLPQDCWQGRFRNVNDNSLKEYRGIHELSKGRFSTGGLIIQSRFVEWLDESSAPESGGEETKLDAGFARSTFYKDEAQDYIESLPESVFRNPQLSDVENGLADK